jgi:hypothetical protein
MADTRRKHVDWTLPDQDKEPFTWQHVEVALLMDIRAELQQLNQLLSCPNFREIPFQLRRIRIATEARRRESRHPSRATRHPKHGQPGGSR